MGYFLDLKLEPDSSRKDVDADNTQIPAFHQGVESVIDKIEVEESVIDNIVGLPEELPKVILTETKEATNIEEFIDEKNEETVTEDKISDKPVSKKEGSERIVTDGKDEAKVTIETHADIKENNERVVTDGQYNVNQYTNADTMELDSGDTPTISIGDDQPADTHKCKNEEESAGLSKGDAKMQSQTILTEPPLVKKLEDIADNNIDEVGAEKTEHPSDEPYAVPASGCQYFKRPPSQLYYKADDKSIIERIVCATRIFDGQEDTDGDGILDVDDTDDDNDGIPDSVDPDDNNDGILDILQGKKVN